LVTNGVTCSDGFSCPSLSANNASNGDTGQRKPLLCSFLGSDSGTSVTLNVGDYNVVEDLSQRIIAAKGYRTLWEGVPGSGIETADEGMV
jgi:hypothetical protein